MTEKDQETVHQEKQRWCVLLIGTPIIDTFDRFSLITDKVIRECLPPVEHENDIVICTDGNQNPVHKAIKAYADSRHYPFREFVPHWEEDGKKAGPMRNKLMIRYMQRQKQPVICLCFWDGESRSVESIIKLLTKARQDHLEQKTGRTGQPLGLDVRIIIYQYMEDRFLDQLPSVSQPGPAGH